MALLARLVGLMSGAKLIDHTSGIRVFDGDIFDQARWLLSLLVVTFWVTSGIRFGAAYLQSMLSAEIWNDLVSKVYRNLMLQNYAFFTQHRTANLSETFNRILNKVSTSVVNPMIIIAGNALPIFVMLVGVVLVLGIPAFAMLSLMLIAYTLSSRLIIPYLRFIAKQRVYYSRQINLWLMESLRSMRDIQLYSADQFFIDHLAHNGVIAKRYDQLAKLLPDVPRYVIEPAGVTILFIIGLGPSVINGDVDEIRQVIPTLIAVLSTLFRISAPLQNTFRNINKLRSGLSEIEDALELLTLKPERMCLTSSSVSTVSSIMPRQFIQLKQASFSYSRREQDVLSNVNLKIPVGSRIALVGRTGSGKTTLVHLLLGLYHPTSGNLCLDGIPLKPQDLPAWQANCALVPQDICLLDTSIRENIAFGIDPKNIDDAQIWAALKVAQLDDVISRMPYSLLTMIGENGIKLSGGQRQRLSLARALYRGAKVLILDEATSALDSKTEHDVMQALDLVGHRCTIIVIAHRLSTVRKCDRIYEIEYGSIKASGDFTMLYASSESFREMTQLEDI
ncbi:ABC transporter ATP-binding protein/permease [Synechococcus sp. M16CYN]